MKRFLLALVCIAVILAAGLPVPAWAVCTDPAWETCYTDCQESVAGGGPPAPKCLKWCMQQFCPGGPGPV